MLQLRPQVWCGVGGGAQDGSGRGDARGGGGEGVGVCGVQGCGGAGGGGGAVVQAGGGPGGRKGGGAGGAPVEGGRGTWRKCETPGVCLCVGGKSARGARGGAGARQIRTQSAGAMSRDLAACPQPNRDRISARGATPNSSTFTRYGVWCG